MKKFRSQRYQSKCLKWETMLHMVQSDTSYSTILSYYDCDLLNSNKIRTLGRYCSLKSESLAHYPQTLHYYDISLVVLTILCANNNIFSPSCQYTIYCLVTIITRVSLGYAICQIGDHFLFRSNFVALKMSTCACS